jgi:hypothetical protein
MLGRVTRESRHACLGGDITQPGTIPVTVPREKYDAFFTVLAEAAGKFGLGYTRGRGFSLLNPYDGYLPSFPDVIVVEQGDRLRVNTVLEPKANRIHPEPLKDLAHSVVNRVVRAEGKPDLAATLYRLGQGPPSSPPHEFLKHQAWEGFSLLLKLIKAGSVRTEADVVSLMQRVLAQLHQP